MVHHQNPQLAPQEDDSAKWYVSHFLFKLTNLKFTFATWWFLRKWNTFINRLPRWLSSVSRNVPPVHCLCVLKFNVFAGFGLFFFPPGEFCSCFIMTSAIKIIEPPKRFYWRREASNSLPVIDHYRGHYTCIGSPWANVGKLRKLWECSSAGTNLVIIQALIHKKWPVNGLLKAIDIF